MLHGQVFQVRGGLLHPVADEYNSAKLRQPDHPHIPGNRVPYAHAAGIADPVNDFHDFHHLGFAFVRLGLVRIIHPEHFLRLYDIQVGNRFADRRSRRVASPARGRSRPQSPGVRPP